MRSLVLILGHWIKECFTVGGISVSWCGGSVRDLLLLKEGKLCVSNRGIKRCCLNYIKTNRKLKYKRILLFQFKTG